MRIPLIITLPTNQTLNFTDHHIVFQLADTLNKINKNEPALKINWIPFFNAPALPESEYTAQPPSTSSDPALNELNDKLNKIKHDPAMWKLVSENIYEAHKKFLGVYRYRHTAVAHKPY